MKPLVCLCIPLCLLAIDAGCAAGRQNADKSSTTQMSTRGQAEQASFLRKSLSFTKAELGADFELADYGRDNPACWNMQNAPTKPKRRIAPLVQSGTAGPETELCYFEYIRRGTHDDILIKIYVFQNSKEAKAALAHPYLQRKSQKLGKYGMQPPTALGNLVYFVTASESNIQKAKELLTLVTKKLKRLGW
ncbi:MAG TPA: hypothetical protein VM425_08475 [Myxococcota bacterium]|nr:hypothetical protein [Myxococcota bacterium]